MALFAVKQPKVETTASLPASERRDRLRLIRSENIGPITFQQLMTRFNSATKALEALPNLARRGGKTKALKICSMAEADAELEQIEKYGAQLIAKDEPQYPKLLAEIEDAPPVITIKGHAHLLQKKMVAIVGARNASAAGRRLTETMAQELGRAGYVIASGLARGIDTSAHAGSLASGTVAVMAGGIDQIYPPENAKLYEQVAEQGALISEIKFSENPTNRHFPRRNRIVSGLALGVLVVEAAAQSGSLITARMALEQNREVFAIPGSPLDPRCKGTNQLIKDGAHLVETPEDIIQELNNLHRSVVAMKPPQTFMAEGMASPSDQDLATAHETISGLLSATPVGVDELVRASHLSVSIVLIVLLELELAGRLERFHGNKVALRYE
jgi:DNA processing protein